MADRALPIFASDQIDRGAFASAVAQGAATTVWCATSRMLEGKGGVYCEDCDIAAAVDADHKELNGVLPWARDEEAAQRLWTLSEIWTA